MINVNFLRKKAKNILPALMAIVFLLGVGAIGAYIYFSRSAQDTELEQSKIWLEENAADIELSREILQVNQWISQAVDVQETLRQKQFPMNRLTENLASFIPNEDTRIASFQLSETSEQVAIVLENTGAVEALEIVNNLEAQPYVKAVQFLSTEAQGQGEVSQLQLFNLIIELDLPALEEEAAK